MHIVMTSQPEFHLHRCALDQVLARRPRQLVYGGGGPTTRLVCGYLACDSRLAGMLLAGLPALLRVNVRGSNAGIWLEASCAMRLTEARSPRPGGAGVLAKLAEVLFIEVLRLYMNEQGEGRTGWLAGVGDRIVGPALNALHTRPAHAWTLDELAHDAGTSRSVLAERFQNLVGSFPMQYLTQWRMLLAANLLCGATRRWRALRRMWAIRPIRLSVAPFGASTAHRRQPGGALECDARGKHSHDIATALEGRARFDPCGSCAAVDAAIQRSPHRPACRASARSR